MHHLSAEQAVSAYYLEARSKLLDLAAIFDRIHRGGGTPDDPKLQKLLRAVELLQVESDTRAATVQEHFSLPYDPTWAVPQPKAG